MTPVIIGGATLYHGDCLAVMRTLADASVDSIVCDPPYELTGARPGGRSAATEGKVMKGFMGMAWDGSGVAFNVDVWREALRVLKPGGHLLAFSGTRTSHRMVCAIEDAGFEIRDSIPWLFGSGFPKSMNVSKAIDKAAGAVCEVVAPGERSAARPVVADQSGGKAYRLNGDASITAPATDAARQWEGFGTALKPAHEPCCMARKPLIGTVAANVLVHGTGAINIDACRVGWPDGVAPEIGTPAWGGPAKKLTAVPGQDGATVERTQPSPEGRWPANVIHDGSDAVLAIFPQSAGQLADVSHTAPSSKTGVVYGPMKRQGEHSQDAENGGSVGLRMKPGARRLDNGSAARFFYCAKASRTDRHEGLEAPGNKFTHGGRMREVENMGAARGGNHHPTVKPTDLMAYLVRLVTPPGGLVLDPFMGSGSTGKACMREGFRFIGIDLSAEYVEIARSRIEYEIAAVAARAAAAQEAADLAARQIDLFAEAP